MSAGLGKGLKGQNYILRRPLKREDWLTRFLRAADKIVSQSPPDAYTFYLAPRDEQGAQAMSELRDRGLGLAADALAKSAEHVESFFRMLQRELAFYVGCLNLHKRLLELKAPFIFPEASDFSPPRFSCREVYDVCLALSMNKRPVGNDIASDGKSLIIVTGANQGGKTTFLRSLGLAQLMTQCGVFAPADRLHLNVVDGLFTHFKREEDTTMKSGKFDEELSRMNQIFDLLTPHAFILFNESFAATNEREGSEIARQIVSAVLERAHKVVFVSHKFAFAHGFFEKRLDSTLFLRANRLEDGRRTFKPAGGEPLSTSFGKDVYREVFVAGAETRVEAPSI
jgi:DNA mismatch repair ATPase MutS